MSYLYINFCDNLEQGSRNYDDYFTQPLTEQYAAIKPRLGIYAPDNLQMLAAQCFPSENNFYYISMPALERSIQTKEKKNGKTVDYINNVVIRPQKSYLSTLPAQYDIIFIGDIAFASVNTFTVKGIELIDINVSKFGEYRVSCMAARAFDKKSFIDQSGRTITVPDYGIRDLRDPVLTPDFIDMLCREVYPIPAPQKAIYTVNRWREYLDFRRYYLGVQSSRCEEITDITVKSSYVVNKASYRKNEADWSALLLDGHKEFSQGEQVILDREVSGADEFPLICVTIEQNRKQLLSDTIGKGHSSSPRYEVGLKRYTRDAMGLSEQRPEYDDKGNLRRGLKYPYILGDRFKFTYTDIEPDCTDLDRQCEQEISQASGEIDVKFSRIIDADVKRIMSSKTAEIMETYRQREEDYARELNEALERDAVENKDKDVRRVYEDKVISPVRKKYRAMREAIEKQLKGEKDADKKDDLKARLEALSAEEQQAISTETEAHPIIEYYRERNQRFIDNHKKRLSLDMKAEISQTRDAKRKEQEEIHQAETSSEKEAAKADAERRCSEKKADRIESETVRRYEIYFSPENQGDTVRDIDKDLKKAEYRYLIYDNRAEKAKLQRQEDALSSLCGGYVRNPYLISYLFAPETLTQNNDGLTQNIEWCLESLNDRQKLAVRCALASESLFLLQGPPGTGKTQVIAEITAQLAKRGKKVLISSETHKAIDNVFERLPKIPEIRPLRLIPSQNGKETNYSPEKLVDNLYLNIQESLRRQVERYEHFNETKETFSRQMKVLRLDYQRLLKLKKKNANAERERSNLLREISRYSEQTEQLRNDRSEAQGIIDSLERARKDIAAYRVDADDVKIQYRTEFEERVRSLLSKFACLSGCGFNQAGELMCIDLAAVESEVAAVCGDGRMASLEQRKAVVQRQMQTLLNPETFDPPEEGEENYAEYKAARQEFIAVNKEIKALKADGSTAVECDTLRSFLPADVIVDKNKLSGLVDEIRMFRIRLNAIVTDLSGRIDADRQPYEEQLQTIEGRMAECAQRINEAKRRCEELNENEDITEQESLQSSLVRKIGVFFRDFGIIREYESGDMDAAFTIIQEEWDRLGRDYEQTRIEDARRIPLFKDVCKYLDSPDILEEDRQTYTAELFKHVNVFGITCTSRDKFNKSQLAELGRYGIGDVNIRTQGIDVVIIDEVSKSAFLDLLIPILYGKTVILVGDHRQLPPMYDLRHLRENDLEGLDEAYITEQKNKQYTKLYEECFFKTLYEQVPDGFRVMLNKQYRCHSHIMEVFNHFYGGSGRGLTVGRKQQDDEKQHGLTVRLNGSTVIDPEHHIYFVDCNEKETSEGDSTSKQNKQEAAVVMALLSGIDEAASALVRMNKLAVNKDRRLDERPSVGVICTYGDQAGLIKKRRKGQQYTGFSQKSDERLIISTVDDFQGDERDIIIVSMVRNPRGQRFSAEFVNQFERINVAFSRARKLLIIVGARQFLSSQVIDLPDLTGNHALDRKNFPVYREIIDTIALRGRILTAQDILGDEDHG